MMISSCKCLNFIATHAPSPAITNSASLNYTSDDYNMSSHGTATIPNALLHTFLQKYPRNFVFYSQCMEFFKQAVGPIPELFINAISQRDLIYSLTLAIAFPDATRQLQTQTWQLSLCINCNSAICAKRLAVTPAQYLVNGALFTSPEEITHRRSDKSYSETFSLLIMDHPVLVTQLSCGSTSSLNNSNLPSGANTDSKQQRLRQLQQNMQQRLKREIDETDERIQRYTEQQFALLKSFREKSEQEYALLMQLIQRVPEQQVSGGAYCIDWLDRSPPSLEVNSDGLRLAGARRRNTISSRRDLTTTPVRPNATAAPTSTGNEIGFTAASSATTDTVTLQTAELQTPATASAIENVNAKHSIAPNTTTNVGITVVLTANRKLTNFDTPPATPEATPMSVGNSPTFTQQQFPTANVNTTVDPADDCLFELEGVEDAQPAALSYHLQNTLHLQRLSQQHQQTTTHSHALKQLEHQLNNNNNMSDLDESDDAEQAEDALDINNSMYLRMPTNRSNTRMISRQRDTSDDAMQLANFAKSLPIEIANSPAVSTSRSYMPESDEDELDNTVDIAASIKALAKSVHGEAVFGDLPRPRLRSQI